MAFFHDLHPTICIYGQTGSNIYLIFPKKSDFCHFVYKAWEEKIDAAYARFGTLVIDYKQYYKTRNRLYQKHYMKL